VEARKRRLAFRGARSVGVWCRLLVGFWPPLVVRRVARGFATCGGLLVLCVAVTSQPAFGWSSAASESSEVRPPNVMGDLGAAFVDAPPLVHSGPLDHHTSGAATATPPQMTFVIDQTTWSAADQATLAGWTAAGSPEMAALASVAGPPGHDETITIVQGNTGFAGEYNPGTHTMTMSSLDLGVFMHELNHAVHDSWIISNEVWEEGLARAAEVAEMDVLNADGVPQAASYFDRHHSYWYDEYYDNTNVPDVGVAAGSIYGYGEAALTLMRYEQAGYAFGKLLIENPQFIVKFNALLFQQASGDLPVATLTSMAASVQPQAEGQPFSAWYGDQAIFDASPPTGCRLFQRVNQFTIDFFCRDSNGLETPQVGATVGLQVYSASGGMLFSGQDTTTSYGSVSFSPSFGSYDGRLQLVATATPSGQATIHSTYYRQSAGVGPGGPGAVFGVITNAMSGTVTLSSPTGQFSTVSVPVANGAFQAPTLEAFAGQVTATFVGGGETIRRMFDKDSSPYSLVMAPGEGTPGTLSTQFIVPSTMSTVTSPTDPYSLFWTQGTCTPGATYTLQESVNGGAFSAVFTGTGTSVTESLLPGNLYTFQVTCGGAPSSATFRLNGFQEGSASYAGTWTSTSFAGAWGGAAKFSSAANASATFTCTCEAFAWVSDEGSNHGSAKVSVDGVLRKTVNTQTSANKNRVVVFKYGWTTDGFHTMKIVNLATAGHPRVNVDGFLTRTSS
jgi:hypothetical protein